MIFYAVLSYLAIFWSRDMMTSSATFVNTVRPWCDEDVDVCQLELNISRSETMKLFGPDGTTHAQPLVLQPDGRIVKRTCSNKSETVTYEGTVKIEIYFTRVLYHEDAVYMYMYMYMYMRRHNFAKKASDVINSLTFYAV